MYIVVKTSPLFVLWNKSIAKKNNTVLSINLYQCLSQYWELLVEWHIFFLILHRIDETFKGAFTMYWNVYFPLRLRPLSLWHPPAGQRGVVERWWTTKNGMETHRMTWRNTWRWSARSMSRGGQRLYISQLHTKTSEWFLVIDANTW